LKKRGRSGAWRSWMCGDIHDRLETSSTTGEVVGRCSRTDLFEPRIGQTNFLADAYAERVFLQFADVRKDESGKIAVAAFLVPGCSGCLLFDVARRPQGREDRGRSKQLPHGIDDANSANRVEMRDLGCPIGHAFRQVHLPHRGSCTPELPTTKPRYDLRKLLRAHRHAIAICAALHEPGDVLRCRHDNSSFDCHILPVEWRISTIFGLAAHDACRRVFAGPPLGSWCLHYFKPSGRSTKNRTVLAVVRLVVAFLLCAGVYQTTALSRLTRIMFQLVNE